jgi:MYXO-CTERM domain-containing protein
VRHAFLAAAAAAGILAVATSARANGRFPQSNQILFSPTLPGLIIVRNTFGITISKDSGNSWYWLCEDTLGLPPTSNEDPFLGLTNNNAIVVGLSAPNGLQVSDDIGCNWTKQGGPLAGQTIKDLVVHQENTHIVDTITNTYDSSLVDGSGGYAHMLFETTDDGATWTAFGTQIDPSADVTTIEVAPSDPNRLYVSAFRGQGPTRTSSLFVSEDHGMTWTEHATPLNPAVETAVYVGGVDPMNADLVYLRSEGLSRLFVSSDGGQTFQVAFAKLTGQMLGFALSPDGSKVYIGSVEDGLFVGDRATLTFVNTNPRIHVQCLATAGTDLWACSDEPSCFVAGVSHDDGKTFTAKMHLLSIQAPIQCSANATAAMCSGSTDAGSMPFPSLCANVGACYGVDAAPVLPLTSTCSCSGACDPANPYYDAAAKCPIVANDASLYCPLDDGGDAGPGGSSSSGGASGSSGGSEGGGGGGGSSKSCGCDVVGGGGALGFLAAAGLGLVAARRRRRSGGRA